MQVKEIDFVLADNSQVYTGQTVEIADVGSPQESYYSNVKNRTVNPAWADGGWSGGSSGDNRLVNGLLTNGGRTQNPIFRSQLIEGRLVLWAANPAPNKDNFAVMSEGTNFEHLWSSWRGQRWVNRANVDEGIMSFKDLVDFHKTEVFSSFSLATDSLTWIDENTLDLTDETLVFGSNAGWSMQFTNSAGDVMVMRSGGDNLAFTNTHLALDFVQHTESDGSIIVMTDGEESSDLMVYDESNIYEGRQETVVRAETISTPNLDPKELTYRIVHISQTDFIETSDVDETQNYWQVQAELESTRAGWDYGGIKYDNQLDADDSLDATIADRMAANDAVGENKATQAAVASGEAAQAARAKAAAAKAKRDAWLDKYLVWIILGGAGLVMIWLMTRTKSGSSSSSSKSPSTKSGSSE